jgi:HlyD family secretion protein
LILICVAVLAAGIYGAWAFFAPQSQEQALHASGRIEAQTVHIASLVGARIATASVRDGDRVAQGQVLFRLNDDDSAIKLAGATQTLSKLQDQEKQLRSLLVNVEQLQEHVASSTPQTGKTSIAVVPSDTAQATTDKLIAEQSGLIDQEQKGELDALCAEEHDARSLVSSTVDKQRQAIEETFKAKQQALNETVKVKLKAVREPFISRLLHLGAADKERQGIAEVAKAEQQALDESHKAMLKSLDQGATAGMDAVTQSFKTKREALQEVSAAKKGALEQGALTQKKAQAEVQAVQSAAQRQMRQYGNMMEGMLGGVVAGKSAAGRIQPTAELKGRLATLQIDILKAQTAVKELTSSLGNYTLTSPISGVCESSTVSAGEMAIPSQTLATIINTDDLSVHVFIPEGMIASVKLHQGAQVFVDGMRSHPLNAEVTRIASQAAFTPESVALPQDRVKQVFDVTLKILEPSGVAKPGMSADVQFADK